MFAYRHVCSIGALFALGIAGCSSSTTGTTSPGSSIPAGSTRAARAHLASLDPNFTVPAGFRLEAIANVPGARELVAAANGDLLVGTEGQTIALVAGAEASGTPSPATTLVTLPEGPAAGIALGPNNTLYVGTEHNVWKLHYAPGDQTESNPQSIAALRTGPVAPGSDGDVHHSTSVIVTAGSVYAAVGSSCNACTEADPGRAAILRMGLGGENLGVFAKNVRNAMALAVNPRTWFMWAGGAGQDNLPLGHPYEYFDAITQHPAGSSWGWPQCEEHNVAYTPGADCSAMIVPHVELPAYSTIIGATFYPLAPSGPYAFPQQYRGGLFLSAHGSWHADGNGVPLVPPHVVFVPMKPNGWDAATPVNWSDPTAQFSVFFSGFNVAGTAQFRGRPTGITFGPQGSVFVADDLTGTIYRIRPNSSLKAESAR